MRYDALVVGAGVSGMTAALRLAARGLSVAIVEAADKIAPTIRGFHRDGAYFDTGFHYTGLLGRDELLGSLLDNLGVWERLACISLEKDQGDRIECARPQFSLQFRQDWAENEAMLGAAFPAERPGLDAYFRAVRTYWEQVPWAVLRGEMGPLDLANETGAQDLLGFLRRHIADPRLIATLCAHGLLYGTPPETTSLLYHAMVAGSYYGQAFQIAGGGSALAAAFEAALQRAGVAIYTHCQVSAIALSAEGAVQGVECNGGRDYFEANTCLFSGDPRLILDLVPERVFRPVYRRRLREMQDTMSAFVLFGLLPEGRSLPPGNLILMRDLEAGVVHAAGALDTRPLFVITSRAQDGPGGISVICPMDYGECATWAGAYTGNRRIGYVDWKRRTADALCTALIARGGRAFEGFRAIEAASPLTFRRYCHSMAGALYGVQHRAGDLPLLPRTKAPGLFLTGQGTLATGVLGAVMSGYVSSDAVMTHLGRGGQLI